MKLRLQKKFRLQIKMIISNKNEDLETTIINNSEVRQRLKQILENVGAEFLV